MQNKNVGQNILDEELISLIEFARWELYHYNQLKKSSKLIKTELILIEKDILKKWKEKSGYNIFKKEIFSHLFSLNKLKNEKDKIIQEKENINKKWNKLISDKIIEPNKIINLPKKDLSDLYLSIKEEKINAYKNYEVISSKLFDIFKNFINYKIVVEGIYNKGKLTIPINYKSNKNLRTSMKSGENFLEIIFINDKNENEDILCILPNDVLVCEQIEKYYIAKSVDDLIKNLFCYINEKDNKYITEFSDNNGNKIQYKLITKNFFAIKSKKQDIIYKDKIDIENNNKKELEKMKLILSQKVQILKEINQRINQRNKNIIKLKSNIKDNNKVGYINKEEENKQLEEIKNKYISKIKEFEIIQKELTNNKESLKKKEESLQNLIIKNNKEIKLKEEQYELKLKNYLQIIGIKSISKLNIKNNNYLIQENQLKDKEENLNKKEEEINRKEQKIKKREIFINKEKEDILNKERELDKKLHEINDKLIYMKNKAYLKKIQEKKEEENLNEDEINMKELEEIEAELEKELDLENLNINQNNNNNNHENKTKKLEKTKDLSNKFQKFKTINLTNLSPTMNNKNIINYSPGGQNYKRSNTMIPDYNEDISNKNDNLYTERHSLKYDFNQTQNLNLNNYTNSSIKVVNKTETKIDKNIPSLGLEQINNPININAVLQCLAHIPELAEGLLELGYKEKYFKENINVELSRNFASIINNIFFPMKYNNNSKIFSPQKFVDIFNRMCHLTTKDSSHNYFRTHEIVKFILDTFHDELNIKKDKENTILKDEKKIDISNEKEVLVSFLTKFTNTNNSLISKLFYGLTKSKCICDSCWKKKYAFNYYNFLYFDLPKIKKYMKETKYKNKNIEFLNLDDCFDYQRREINITSLFDEVNLSTLDEFGINKNTGMAFCDKCQTETKCSLYNYLYSANTILPIIFERGNDNYFFAEDIKFPEELNLEYYVEFNKSIKKYYLCGVVSNLGKNNKSGRFVAYCRMSQNGKWYKYNNEKVNICSLKDIYKEGIPYMLIYHKI